MKKNWFSSPKNNIASSENIFILMQGHIDDVTFQNLVKTLEDDLILNLRDIYNKIKKETYEIEQMIVNRNMERVAVKASIVKSMSSAYGIKTLCLIFGDIEKEANLLTCEPIKILEKSRKALNLINEYIRILGD